MMDLQAVNEATPALLAQGIRVMHANLFAETEEAHVAYLLELMNPKHGAVVLDAGCGVGEVARIMKDKRPDLSFVLLNISRVQLDDCPEGMERIEGDFMAVPLAVESVDVVMFHYAICHAGDIDKALREARRVLRPDGELFINDMSRDGGDNDLMVKLLGAAAHQPGDLVDAALRAGFVFEEGHFHTPVVQRLREVFDSQELYDQVFQGVEPATWRFSRPDLGPIASAFARHERIGFQFSGGRDSTAALYLLRPYWDRMVVYHLDTGDQFPETREVVRRVEADMGRPVTVIEGDVAAVRRDFGLASDLVPVDNTPVGRMVSGREVKLIGRYECCARALMSPLQQRIQADGITLIVRGQRDEEYSNQPMRSGDVQDGMEVLYPIQSWTGDEVSAYLTKNGHPIAPFYERGARRAPECMGCTAWWDEGRAVYLRDHHPEAFERYSANMKTIRIEIDRQYATLD